MSKDSSNIRTENGVVVGNVTEKRTVPNPIARYLVQQFDARISGLIKQVAPKHILEVGCGEGEIIKMALANTQAKIVGVDISDVVLDKARQNVSSDRVRLEKLSIYDVPETDAYQSELVVCCEVLEHLDDPEAGLRKLHALTTSHCILSVPREPLWCMLNMVRGSYLKSFGNTPGHIQHWGKKSFLSFVSQLFVIEKVYTPMPWTMVLCRKK
ncbi:class I SAM-dependent methyltransferase [Pseudodesulfovibrio sp. zrk46]|uniref:class I SAM-dependent methyltransferase n=1 Tax=Pseudodesulfovibrio sp. zrk46 TaxID=2725288 RepID=UPI00144903E5|nr:class I SAM-dependent methyltransferase [Pseudodesulfovibrio sp. zrk46]QJB55675.1 class I SAM-dependent methyltransferase [Pseudodesulfovibrio sp. zrk46]